MSRWHRTAVMLVVVALSGVTALPAFGQDLGEWLERAARAEYTGRQFTLCDTPDGDVVEIVEVTQRAGILEVSATVGSAVVSPDGLYTRTADGSMSVTTATSSSEWQLAERYVVQFGEPASVLNRAVDVLRVMEGELERMQLSFDRRTGAVLAAHVNNSDESRYCTSSFLTFHPEAVDISPPRMVAEVIEPTTTDDRRLPPSLAGFTRKDAYPGPANTVTGFYSDGIFSFTLVAANRGISVRDLPESTSAEINGSEYERSFSPGQSVHVWETPRGGYVMLGDLPLDLQADVLEELPAPGKPAIFTRVWRRLFG